MSDLTLDNGAPTLKGSATYAWAAVAKKDGRILRNGRGHYGIYTHKADAVDDCPMYGQVRRVRITLAPLREGNK